MQLLQRKQDGFVHSATRGWTAIDTAISNVNISIVWSQMLSTVDIWTLYSVCPNFPVPWCNCLWKWSVSGTAGAGELNYHLAPNSKNPVPRKQPGFCSAIKHRKEPVLRLPLAAFPAPTAWSHYKNLPRPQHGSCNFGFACSNIFL